MKNLLITFLASTLFLTACSPMKTEEIPESAEVATLAAGCFWCIENTLDHQEGVYEATSGYSGGSEETADYYTVASGKTKHREAIQVYFDPEKLSYEQLLDVYWRQINPTDPTGQFTDRGYQYTTAIYAHNDEQFAIAEASKITQQENFDEPIATEILRFENFFPAEEEHQNYAQKNAARYQIYKTGSGR